MNHNAITPYPPMPHLVTVITLVGSALIFALCIYWAEQITEEQETPSEPLLQPWECVNQGDLACLSRDIREVI